jgi:hypothetical protein
MIYNAWCMAMRNSPSLSFSAGDFNEHTQLSSAVCCMYQHVIVFFGRQHNDLAFTVVNKHYLNYGTLSLLTQYTQTSIDANKINIWFNLSTNRFYYNVHAVFISYSGPAVECLVYNLEVMSLSLSCKIVALRPVCQHSFFQTAIISLLVWALFKLQT